MISTDQTDVAMTKTCRLVATPICQSNISYSAILNDRCACVRVTLANSMMKKPKRWGGEGDPWNGSESTELDVITTLSLFNVVHEPIWLYFSSHNVSTDRLPVSVKKTIINWVSSVTFRIVYSMVGIGSIGMSWLMRNGRNVTKNRPTLLVL